MGQPAFRNEKFESTGETKLWLGVTLHRIRAVRDIAALGIVAGAPGGWIEKESNVEVYGNAWVSGNARVYGDARVSGDAQVSGNARVSGDAQVYGNARVSGDAQVYGNAWVYDNARVYDNAWVSGNAWVYGDAQVSGNAWVSGDAQVYGNAWVYDNARVYDNAWVYDNARVYDNAWVSGNARVSGDAWVSGRNHLGWFSCVGSENGTLCWFLQKDRSVRVNRDCFSGSLADFSAAVEARHGDNPVGQQYRLLIQFIELRSVEALKDYAPADTSEAEAV